MLTEGWDANTVTHVLGVRAFGTQLLCEQVIGRALRRQSYNLNDEGLFEVEYADVNDDFILELTPDLVGPSITKNAGIIGEDVDLSLEHLEDMRPSTLLFHVAKRLLYTKWRDPGEEPKLHLFGQLKRITKQWLDSCLVCRGETYPALLMYQELADMACERITAAITRALVGERPIKAVLDPYNPTGSTIHVNFNTSKRARWQTDARRCHINWVVLDSDWEAEFCRVAEAHPRVRAYVKNHNLSLEVPYRYGSEMRKYLPDFIVLVDDRPSPTLRPAGGHGEDDPLHLIVEIKGYRREDAKEKKATMETVQRR
jgi:type III restriction enzyme